MDTMVFPIPLEMQKKFLQKWHKFQMPLNIKGSRQMQEHLRWFQYTVILLHGVLCGEFPTHWLLMFLQEGMDVDSTNIFTFPRGTDYKIVFSGTTTSHEANLYSTV